MTLDHSGNFKIRVHGVVDARWADYFGETVIEREESPSGSVSVLHGQFQDKAALMGILNTLYDLGFPLLSFECVEQGDAAAPDMRTTDAYPSPPANVG